MKYLGWLLIWLGLASTPVLASPAVQIVLSQQQRFVDMDFRISVPDYVKVDRASLAWDLDSTCTTIHQYAINEPVIRYNCSTGARMGVERWTPDRNDIINSTTPATQTRSISGDADGNDHTFYCLSRTGSIHSQARLNSSSEFIAADGGVETVFCPKITDDWRNPAYHLSYLFTPTPTNVTFTPLPVGATDYTTLYNAAGTYTFTAPLDWTNTNSIKLLSSQGSSGPGDTTNSGGSGQTGRFYELDNTTVISPGSTCTVVVGAFAAGSGNTSITCGAASILIGNGANAVTVTGGTTGGALTNTNFLGNVAYNRTSGGGSNGNTTGGGRSGRGPGGVSGITTSIGSTSASGAASGAGGSAGGGNGANGSGTTGGAAGNDATGTGVVGTGGTASANCTDGTGGAGGGGGGVGVGKNGCKGSMNALKEAGGGGGGGLGGNGGDCGGYGAVPGAGGKAISGTTTAGACAYGGYVEIKYTVADNDIIFMQNGIRDHATPPIVTAGAAVSRASENFTIDLSRLGLNNLAQRGWAEMCFRPFDNSGGSQFELVNSSRSDGILYNRAIKPDLTQQVGDTIRANSTTVVGVDPHTPYVYEAGRLSCHGSSWNKATGRLVVVLDGSPLTEGENTRQVSTWPANTLTVDALGAQLTGGQNLDGDLVTHSLGSRPRTDADTVQHSGVLNPR